MEQSLNLYTNDLSRHGGHELTSYAMVVCRLHDTAWGMVHVIFISRHTGKILLHWARECFHAWIDTKLFTHNINVKNESVVFINILFICINIIKSWHKKKSIWTTGAWGWTPFIVTPHASPLTCNLRWYN